MALTDEKIKLIKECWEEMNALQTTPTEGQPPDTAKVGQAYMTMLRAGVGPEDIMEFGGRFPEMRMGVSGSWSPSR